MTVSGGRLTQVGVVLRLTMRTLNNTFETINNEESPTTPPPTTMLRSGGGSSAKMSGRSV